MTSPTLTDGAPPPGSYGTAEKRKKAVARQLAALFALARRWLASGGRPKR